MLKKAYARFPMLSLQLGRYFYQIPCWYRQWFKPERTFTFQGRTYEYFLHPYNTTWRNERALEVPIVHRMMADFSPENVLEVGNVLSHYFRSSHTVVDKYERSRRVIAQDAVDFRGPHPYELIVSISTLEHVGWDEHPKESGKHRRVFQHLRTLLAPGGKLVATLPLGYNPWFDDDLHSGKLDFDELHFYRRTDPEKWVEAQWDEVKEAKFGDPFRGSSAFVICVTYQKAGI